MTNLDQCYNIFDLREIAQRRLPKGIFEYVDKGTEDGLSLEENRAAFQRIKLHTHFLNDWSKRDLGTEIFGQRINLPFGILAALGVLLLLPETKRDPNYRFDMLGFVLLSLAVGALQMMLDRGATLDWFSSMEIVIEGVVAALALYLFIVHMLTAEKPFLSPEPLRDMNYSVGMVLGFFTGIALLPTLKGL